MFCPSPLSPAEADTAEDQDEPNLPTVSSKDVMKLSLVEDNTVILQVEEDRSSLPPPRKKRISQADGHAIAKEKKSFGWKFFLSAKN